jgi:hypothetical protein
MGKDLIGDLTAQDTWTKTKSSLDSMAEGCFKNVVMIML